MSKKETAKAFYRYAASFIDDLIKSKKENKNRWIEEVQHYAMEKKLHEFWKEWIDDEEWEWGNEANPTHLYFKLGNYVGKRKIDDLYVKIMSLTNGEIANSNMVIAHLFNQFAKENQKMKI